MDQVPSVCMKRPQILHYAPPEPKPSQVHYHPMPIFRLLVRAKAGTIHPACILAMFAIKVLEGGPCTWSIFGVPL
ncbi:hypothetical protein MGG_15935 [Pyricularia oryzae 70-15]|uniref:Uncharacterized protein n=2 Tax=Pyricularia oryzae TaxID=318829 RepID=G4MWE4_PYRO7|nr:uncharacterized protein MGG_15935 [Pyricularia oryzae 70-15]EHA55904.1 hypothetical protein MGG_15935 [Pyricularia oryzae 70-15]KAI7910826.1 hypothetical protein M0657_011220 [Pyricularia oryzae]KAI7911601.1 hypothetical protein M9X92_010447 [Pyricularia oryzae]QBZ57686.1 hypothetical protein PoMZ_02621 [Pyricularia oryzae]